MSGTRPPGPPAEAVRWFITHWEPGHARELARAEHAARRAGYTTRWDRTWACQVLDGDEALFEGETAISLDAHPCADPRARDIERRLIESAGLDDPASPGHDFYCVNWVRQSTCRIYAPGGALLDQCSDTASLLAEMSADDLA